MHLLPHKSWNVWSSKNIAKVRKDEKEHEEEESKKRKRQREIESEIRIERLRESMGKKPKVEREALPGQTLAEDAAGLFGLTPGQFERMTDNDIELIDANQHFNLFPEASKKVDSSSFENPEYLAEKKAKEARETKGLTSYLGESDRKPWWMEAQTDDNPALTRRIERRNAELDPLHTLNKYIKKKQAYDQNVDIRDLDSYYKDKNHRNSKHSKHRRSAPTSSTPTAVPPNTSDLPKHPIGSSNEVTQARETATNLSRNSKPRSSSRKSKSRRRSYSSDSDSASSFSRSSCSTCSGSSDSSSGEETEDLRREAKSRARRRKEKSRKSEKKSRERERKERKRAEKAVREQKRQDEEAKKKEAEQAQLAAMRAERMARENEEKTKLSQLNNNNPGGSNSGKTGGYHTNRHQHHQRRTGDRNSNGRRPVAFGAPLRSDF